MIAKIGSFEIMPGVQGSEEVVLIGLVIEMDTLEQKAAVCSLIANSQLMNHEVNIEITAMPKQKEIT